MKNTVTKSHDMMENYKNSLATIIGYTNPVDEDKIDLYKAQSVLDEIHGDDIRSHSKNIEKKVFSVTDAMGLERSIINTYIRKNDELNSTYLSCFVDVLQATLSQYGDKLDKVA